MLREFWISLTHRLRRGHVRDSAPLLNVSRTNSHTSANGTTIDCGQHLRAKLRFFFMSPCWKWHLTRHCPWKAWFQFLKTILLTTQLILFGIERQTHVIYIAESNITFHHLFVRGWETSLETLPYPRASGDFAVYTNDDMIDSINYAVHQFNNLTALTLGLFDFDDHSDPKYAQSYLDMNHKHIQMCLNRFLQCETNPSSHSYTLDIRTKDICFRFNATDEFNVDEYLSNRNETLNYCSLNYLTLEFVIHAIQLKNQRPFSLPDCYRFLVKLTFDNNARTGKIRQYLDSQAQFRSCNQDIIDGQSSWTLMRRDLLIIFDCFIIVTIIISFILCLRSLWQGHKLCREVRLYFKTELIDEKPLTWNDIKVFYSNWYILMVITDLMVLPGSIIKIVILYKVSDAYDAAGLLLGLSSFFSWICILRYLSFFRKYNLLFITVKKALPQLLRFLLCALIIYCAFMFCGWIVLGPYHTKFRTLATTFETLFALINGDDMYTTFANLETESVYIWLFSEIYLYSFVCLFIYVVASLVIALLIDGYETVKKYYAEGFPKTRLQNFSEEDVARSSSSQDWQDLTTALAAQTACFPCCCRTPTQLIELQTRDPYMVRHSNAFS